jgi:transposase
LGRLVGSGREAARKIARARVLLRCDGGESDEEVAEAVGVSVATVERVRKRFADGRLDPPGALAAALDRKPQPPRPQKKALDGAGEAHLIALACSKPPDGRPEWTLRLLADRAVELKYAESVSYETVRRVLKKVGPSRG